MFSSTRAAVAAAFVIVALTSFPAFGAERAAGTTMPSVDFTLASEATYVAGVPPTIPPSMLADVLGAPAVPAAPAAPLSTPMTAPASDQRRIEMSVPRGEGLSGGTSLRRGMYLSFAALQVMDFVSTNKAIAAGGVEANPAMSGIVNNLGAFMAVKDCNAAAASFLSEKVAKRHPRRATIMMAVLNTAYAGIVAHNYRVARSNR